MKWHVENWRKIYTTKTAEWLRLPVSARGLGRELLTYCDDTGRVAIGDDEPGEALAYLLGARRPEHARIAADVAALIADGYLVREPAALWIRNYEEAQDRTPGAKRTAAWRARASAPASHVTSRSDAREASPGDETETSHVQSTVTAKRNDTTRHDTKEEMSESDSDVSVLAPALLDIGEPGVPKPRRRPAVAARGPVAAVWGAWLDARARTTPGGALPVLTAQRRDLIRRRLADYDEATLVDAARGVWASSFNRSGGHTGLELALRDAAHIERYGAYARGEADPEARPHGGAGPPVQRSAGGYDEERERVAREQWLATRALSEEVV